MVARRISWLVLLALLFLTSASLAQPNTQTKAKAMFEQAEAYYKIREFEKALPFYKEAYLISLEPSMLFNMAQCYRQLGRLREAIDSYKSFLRDSKPTHPLRPKAELLLKEAEDALKTSPETQPASMPQTQPATAPSTKPAAQPTSIKIEPSTAPVSLPATMLSVETPEPSKLHFIFYGGGAATGAAALVVGSLALSASTKARRGQQSGDFSDVKRLHDRALGLGIVADLFLLSSGALTYLGYRNRQAEPNP